MLGRGEYICSGFCEVVSNDQSKTIEFAKSGDLFFFNAFVHYKENPWVIIVFSTIEVNNEKQDPTSYIRFCKSYLVLADDQVTRLDVWFNSYEPDKSLTVDMFKA